MILTNWQRAREISLMDFGQVGAGTVVDFLPRGETKVILPASVKADNLVTVSVSGDSLRDMGINDGDRLICRTKFEKAEIKNGKLIIAEIPCAGLVVKFFYKFGKKIVLRSANPAYADLIYDSGLVAIKAIVMQSVKTWE